jgi:filamentous hemagglutinin
MDVIARPWEVYLAQQMPGTTRLPYGFEAFDFFDRTSGVAISAKTLDTATAARIANPQEVYSTLVPYIDAAADFTRCTRQSTSGAVTITSNMITAREIQLAVPRATTAAQWEQLNRAVQYGQGRRVTIRISVIN